MNLLAGYTDPPCMFGCPRHVHRVAVAIQRCIGACGDVQGPVGQIIVDSPVIARERRSVVRARDLYPIAISAECHVCIGAGVSNRVVGSGYGDRLCTRQVHIVVDAADI